MVKLPKAFKSGRDSVMRIAHMAEAFTLIGALFGTGFFVGQWVTYQVAVEERAELRREHLRELARMSDVHSQVVDTLAGKLVRATSKVADAADKAETAAVTAEKVTREVRQVSRSAEKRVNAELINKSVEQANGLKKQ